MNEYDYSNAGFALTRSFEGLRLTAYQDSAGVWTIGYGHTGCEAHSGQCISEIEAEALLRADLAAAVQCVRRAVQVDLSQHQFDALVDFCFNVGRGSFLGSSLLRYVNQGEFNSAVVQFGLWVHAGGKVLPGLVRRRAAEAALFSGHGLPSCANSTSDAMNPHASTEVGVAEPESALALTGKGR
jgi:lysozyme